MLDIPHAHVAIRRGGDHGTHHVHWEPDGPWPRHAARSRLAGSRPRTLARLLYTEWLLRRNHSLRGADTQVRTRAPQTPDAPWPLRRALSLLLPSLFRGWYCQVKRDGALRHRSG